MAQYNAYGQQYYDTTGGSTYSTNAPTAAGASQTPQTTFQPFLTSSTYALAQAQQQSALSQLSQLYQNPVAYQNYQTVPNISQYHTIQRQAPNPRAGQTEANAIWMGDLDPWMDENFVFR